MSPSAVWSIRGRHIALERPVVMGIINVTPDSFSDGGAFLAPGAALARAAQLIEEGADILDVGGESTRPHGAMPVPVTEERRRVLPVIDAIVRRFPDVVLSVDTTKAEVAAAALDAGAHIVNDVSGMRLDPAMAGVCAARRAGAILMHSRGHVGDMATYDHADYAGDVLDAIERELLAQVAVALAAGLARERIVLDPGIGFAKRAEHSLRALAGVGRLAQLGFPIAVGASRKRFIGALTGVADAPARVFGSLGAAVSAYQRGASIFRVHDVAATRQALDVAAAIGRAAVREVCPA